MVATVGASMFVVHSMSVTNSSVFIVHSISLTNYPTQGPLGMHRLPEYCDISPICSSAHTPSLPFRTRPWVSKPFAAGRRPAGAVRNGGRDDARPGVATKHGHAFLAPKVGAGDRDTWGVGGKVHARPGEQVPQKATLRHDHEGRAAGCEWQKLKNKVSFQERLFAPRSRER